MLKLVYPYMLNSSIERAYGEIKHEYTKPIFAFLAVILIFSFWSLIFGGYMLSGAAMPIR
jgi:hypothetical protein